MKLALLFVGLVLCLAYDETVLFSAWKSQYNKVYVTDEEEAVRFNNFKLSLDRIASRNAKSTNAVFGLTKFSDLSPEEFKSFYLGYIRPERDETVGVLESKIEDAPSTLDWRNKNMVTPVKDQGQCGSCWAFSVTENIESMYCMKNNIDCSNSASFSPLAPQEIVDCDDVDQGCNGGDPPTAYKFVISTGGMEDESDYPYTAEDGNCAFDKSKVAVTISSWQYATTNSNEKTLQNNLASWGPLSICVEAEPWQDYTGGILMASDCDNNLDHCVQLVGYDMTQSTPFWIVRNSWGADWGENGYIRLQADQDTCGMADEATSSII